MSRVGRFVIIEHNIFYGNGNIKTMIGGITTDKPIYEIFNEQKGKIVSFTESFHNDIRYRTWIVDTSSCQRKN